ncbi:Secreted protein, contains PKD repeats and vWA domain [Halapricum desulfuricans]|uniref:Secreted protein, contains PKD repeats and vWA domain n=1 Tax=Halapricum desulfuricans TaxID=2841257 RepID=A0A897NRA6_9EURY|nr:PKD domain-containing protein [Halapricum desulfuricans]QSG13369.1 Secreted protein, contains PKD repeats and vWA domain [Halapricum desulfuricans]
MSLLLSLLITSSVIAVSLGVGPGVVVAADRNGGIDNVSVYERIDEDGDGYASTIVLRVEADTHFKEYLGVGKGNPLISIRARLAGENQQYGLVAHRVLNHERSNNGVYYFEISAAQFHQHANSRTATEGGTFEIDRISVLLQDYEKLNPIKVALNNPDSFRVIGDTSDDRFVLRMNSRNAGLELPVTDATDVLRVESNVQEAEVYLDGQWVGWIVGGSPLAVSVPVDDYERNGLRTIRVVAPGYDSNSVQVSVRPPTVVSVPLTRTTKPITVTSTPKDASVSVNGVRVGTTPYFGQYAAGSSYRVSVYADGYLRQDFENVRPGTTLHAELPTIGEIDIDDGETTSIDFGTNWWHTPIGDFSGSLQDATTIETDVVNGEVTGGTVTTDVQNVDTTTLVVGTEAFDFSENIESVLPALNLPSATSAAFVASPDRPVVRTPLQFDAGRSYSLLGNVTDYAWDFGDGTTAIGRTPGHTYQTAGVYQVSLTITDEAGGTATATRSVTVQDEPPTARLSWGPYQPTSGQIVSFDASGSTDPEDGISRYEWDLGDGRTAGGQQVSHAYSVPGQYVISLTVVDATGNEDTLTRTVAVEAPNQEPNAQFTTSDQTVVRGTAVAFDGSASSDPDGTLVAYEWDFGDGGIATGPTATYMFDTAGTFIVSLDVLDDQGARASDTVNVTVQNESVEATTTSQPPATQTPTTTDGAPSTDTPAAPTTDTGTGFGPGFGPVSALLAVIAGIALLARRREMSR